MIWTKEREANGEGLVGRRIQSENFQHSGIMTNQ